MQANFKQMLKHLNLLNKMSDAESRHRDFRKAPAIYKYQDFKSFKHNMQARHTAIDLICLRYYS
jgi:hypothetical protein